MRFWLSLGLILVLVISGCVTQPPQSKPLPPSSINELQPTPTPVGNQGSNTPTPVSEDSGIHKIKHIVIIMQENRAFDHYFGTYPGAEGIPMENGVPTACVLDPNTGNCVQPFHSTKDRNEGGPHGAPSSVADINGGKMDGFIGQQEEGSCHAKRALTLNVTPNVALILPDFQM